MLVYGERQRVLQPRSALSDIARRLSEVGEEPPGLDRHASLAEIFLNLGMLVQGLLDARFEEAGEDEDTPLQADAAQALHSVARPLIASWRAGFLGSLHLDPAAIKALAAHSLPEQVRCKRPEGYAYYAVYPEAYAQAACDIGEAGLVIGLRSIGVTLAAAAAAGLGASPPVTLRPVGHPYQRELALSAALQARLSSTASPVVVADEGPGRSGSSFGAVGDWFEERGVGVERLVFMPSHRGDPGPMASRRHLQRWASVRRPVRELDDLIIHSADERHRLARWVEHLTGPALLPLEDISAGRWRARRDPAHRPPVYAGQERRKFLLTSASGVWLLKFIGLGVAGREAFERARRLGEAGLTPRPAGYCYGFLVEPWIEAPPLTPDMPVATVIEAIARYLSFRAHAFPAEAGQGASECELRAMIHANVAEGLGASAALALTSRLPSCEPSLRPMRVDGRLHRWEWLKTGGGRLLKTDAVDHDDAHDLIGCQDLAWDVAGAEAEFAFSAADTQALLDALARSKHSVRPDALAFMRIAYPAFQLGLWTHALEGADPDDQAPIARLVQGYARRLEALAASLPCSAPTAGE